MSAEIIVNSDACCYGLAPGAAVAAWRTHSCEHVFARAYEGVHTSVNAARVGACATQNGKVIDDP